MKYAERKECKAAFQVVEPTGSAIQKNILILLL